MKITKCKSFQDWMDKIQERNKGCTLIPMDNILDLCLGFYDSKNDEQFLVSYLELNNYKLSLSSSQASILDRALSSQEGKEAFLNFKA